MIGSCEEVTYDMGAIRWDMPRPARVGAVTAPPGWGGRRDRHGEGEGGPGSAVSATGHARNADEVHVAASNERRHVARVLLGEPREL